MWSWFIGNHPVKPTHHGLLKFAAAYFEKYQDGLTSGTVKGKLGLLNITVSFTVDEEDRRV